MVVFSFLILFTLLFTRAVGQTYGLRFASHNVLKENRTSLDLNHDNYFSFDGNFELSFSFLLNEHDNMYFGYIVRIIDNDGRNVDLMFNYQSRAQNSFEIVYKNEVTTQPLKSNFAQLCQEWTNFKLQFNPKNHQLTFFSPDTMVIINNIQISGKVKILFGASDYSHFKTTDVPPMSIKDIQISAKGKVLYEWPLNETSGEIAHEKNSKRKAQVLNPEWLSPVFQNWINEINFNIEGNAEITYNEGDELVYIIGDNKLMIYNIRDNQMDSAIYTESPSILKAGCQAFYDPGNNQIVTYNVDLKTISTYNLETNEWVEMVAEYYPLTVYWHHNKYYSTNNKNLYTFGGYGQHEYKNVINRFSMNSNTWNVVQPEGEVYSPRYLAALGYHNDTIYILGGYGSLSGKQILNPQNYYDLWMYSMQENRFIKKYEFETPIEDIAFANSMIIDGENHEFYALAFPIFKHESYLQLFKGSLENPELIPAGNAIPYKFHDIISYADLFYASDAKKLVTATSLYNEENYTSVSLFHINFPPNQNITYDTSKTGPFNLKTVLFILAIITLIAILTIRKKKLSKPTNYLSVSDNTMPAIHDNNSILFFGDFQFLNNAGQDLTSKFSPLLKELFMLIWFNSVKDKGISSERLIDILWFDKDEKSAKNNLAVNIAKLKQLVSEIDTMKLSRQTGYWMFVFDDSIVYNDYLHCLKMAKFAKSSTKVQIDELIQISQKGHFLESCPFLWLDDFKAEISNVIIDTLISYSENFDIADNPDFILHLADAILNFDIMNEEAIHLKCKALIIQGKHNLAKETFSKFTKEYKTMYNSPYPKTFLEVMK